MSERLKVGPWLANRNSGELLGAHERRCLEPKVMDLLFLLASRAGEVVSKEQIFDSLWRGVVVGEDTLARTVSKLRKALGDDPKSPVFIETIPKRGYRFIAGVELYGSMLEHNVKPAESPSPVRAPRVHASLVAVAGCMAIVIAAALWMSAFSLRRDDAVATTRRADDFYFQIRRASNEAAIELYEKVIETHPGHAAAYAGLANALVQRVIRWPDPPGATEYKTLGEALQNGHTHSPPAAVQLGRAEALARAAIRLAPSEASSHKALGFVYGARGDFENALTSYRHAVSIDANAWVALVNIADILSLSGRKQESLHYLEQAFGAMERVQELERTHVLPWYAGFAVLIGNEYQDKGELSTAERWYRRALDYAPLDGPATSQLAKVLWQSGHREHAAQLCAALRQRVDDGQQCQVGAETG